MPAPDSSGTNSPGGYRGGRMLGVPLVGQVNGRKRVRWLTAAIFAVGLGFWVGVLSAGVGYFLMPHLVPLLFILGFQGPCIMIGSAIFSALRVPVEQLPPLK